MATPPPPGTPGNSSPQGPNDPSWEIGDDELSALENGVFGTGTAAQTPKQIAARLFDENATTAALQIINLCKTGVSERIRFDAAKYILDRSMGTLMEQNSIARTLAGAAGEDDELMKFVRAVNGVQ